MYDNIYIYIIVMLFNGLYVCSHERSPVRLLRQILYHFIEINGVLNCLSLLRLLLTKYQMRQLKLQTFIFSRLWRLEVHNHGCWQIWFLMGALFLALQMAFLCVRTRPVLCACEERGTTAVSSTFIRTHTLSDQDFTLMTSLNLNYLVRILSPSIVTLGVRASA